ncbi:MAG: energy transducer TonB [Bacteroidota bacterium]
MRNLVLVIPLIFCLSTMYAQSVPEDGLYKVVDEMPRFPGCEDIKDEWERKRCSEGELTKFLYTNLKYPKEARDKGIEGMCLIQFIVEEDGSISNIELTKDIGGGCGEELVNLIYKMVDEDIFWIPGVHNEKNVSVRFTLPVKFKSR